ELSKDFSLFVHGLGMSLGTPGPLDKQRMEMFKSVVDRANPLWISEHVAFTRAGEIDLGHLNPIRASRESLQIVSDHAIELSEYCGKKLLLENITSHIQLPGEMSETDFLGMLCEKAHCGLLLDVTNLFVNSQNHR